MSRERAFRKKPLSWCCPKCHRWNTWVPIICIRCGEGERPPREA